MFTGILTREDVLAISTKEGRMNPHYDSYRLIGGSVLDQVKLAVKKGLPIAKKIVDVAGKVAPVASNVLSAMGYGQSSDGAGASGGGASGGRRMASRVA